MNQIEKANKVTAILKSQRGFSLVEILVSLTLIGIAGTFVVGKIINSLNEGKVSAANIQMSGFAAQLKDFKRKCNFYPDTSQGLEALLEKPSGRECKNYPPGGFIEGEDIPLDPWDSDYTYESDGKKFSIKSLGGDNEEGGEDYDADLFYPKKKRQ